MAFNQNGEIQLSGISFHEYLKNSVKDMIVKLMFDFVLNLMMNLFRTPGTVSERARRKSIAIIAKAKQNHPAGLMELDRYAYEIEVEERGDPISIAENARQRNLQILEEVN